MIQRNDIAGGEFIVDEVNNWDWDFWTDDETQIGEYTELESYSIPKKRLATKAGWMTIRKKK